ncbi:hypothetical protein G6F37_006120 [Rhizopus arrhizus]|nr:hypothetical protein G6F38_008768 [Rhizopus arrhizus]KAG1158085.1 hypothetical protein G6F37_006120 [Rhizopus arrhizus]
MPDPSSLKVTELRAELSNRNLSTKGKKNELVARLTEALETEKPAEETVSNEEEKSDLETKSEQESSELKVEEETKEDESIQQVEQLKQEATDKPINVEEKTDSAISNKAQIDENENEKAKAELNEKNKNELNNQKESKEVEEAKKESVEEKPSDKTAEEKESNEEVAKTKSNEEDFEEEKIANKEQKPLNESEIPTINKAQQRESEAFNSMETDDERGVKRRSGENDEKYTEEKRMKIKDKEDQTINSSAIIVKGFVRPLIVRQAQELFAKHGDIKRFWMDSIKTHCYVIYGTIEEAQKAYTQVNGIIFPSDTGRKLIVEGLTPEQAEGLIEYEQSAAEQHLRSNWEEMVLKVKSGEALPSSPTLDVKKSRSVGIGQIAKQLAQAASPSEKPKPIHQENIREERRGLSLEDLFRKTKATPHLYYLPVSEEEAKVKMNQLKSLH